MQVKGLPKPPRRKSRAVAPYATAIAVTAVLVLPVLAWRLNVVSRNAAAAEAQKQAAYAAGEEAFSTGAARRDAPDEHWYDWTRGYDAAAEAASTAEANAKAAEKIRLAASARKHAEREREWQAEKARREIIRKQHVIWKECERHLDETYRASAKYRERMSDFEFITEQMTRAPAGLEHTMQSRLRDGLVAQMGREEYQCVREVLVKHGLHSLRDWEALEHTAMAEGW